MTLSPDAIDACLPQTQCTQCGFPRCRDYAEAVATSTAGINQCPPGGEVTIQALAKLLGVRPNPLNPDYGTHQPRTRALIDEARCIGCRKCLDVCPVDAIVGAHRLMHTVIISECTGCALCLPPCPVDCIILEPASPALNPGPWPEYAHAETQRWRILTERRLARKQRRPSAPAPRQRGHAATAIPDREQIHAEIQAAVARVKAKKQNRQD
jgi:electron transport complex protein RnfB